MEKAPSKSVTSTGSHRWNAQPTVTRPTTGVILSLLSKTFRSPDKHLPYAFFLSGLHPLGESWPSTIPTGVTLPDQKADQIAWRRLTR